MKEAIRMGLESIYEHFRSSRHSALRRIKEECSRWFVEFDMKCFHENTIDRHRLIPIFLEEIDDPKFFYSIQSAGRGGSKGPGPSVPHSVLLSAILPGNIYLHKLDQEIGKIRQKYEITIVQRIRSVLLRTGRGRIDVDDKENWTGESSFNAPDDNRAIIVGRLKSIQRKYLVVSLSSAGTPQATQKKPFVFFPPSALFAFLNKPSSLSSLSFAGLTKAEEFDGQECCCPNKNWALRDLLKSSKIKGIIRRELGEAILVIRSDRARKLATLKTHYLLRICYVRYADSLLLGIVGAVELLIEIQKRLAHFLQSGLNLWVGSVSTRARSTVEFLPGTVIREVPRTTPRNQFFRELEKRLRVKHRIHRTSCHLRSAIHSKFRKNRRSIPIKQLTKGLMIETGSLVDGVLQRADKTLGTDGVSASTNIKKQQAYGTVQHIKHKGSTLHSSGRSIGHRSSRGGITIRHETHAALSLYTTGEDTGREISAVNEFPFSRQIEAPLKKILRRLQDRGIISRRRPWPIHVGRSNVSDGDIVTWSAGIAISPLSYYRCRDNLYQVRTIVHQIRWSAIFTLAHKHKSSSRNIIPKYSKDSNLVNEDGKTLAEFPNIN
uniref:Maturase n=1 Tax=Epirixanthes elongata TaxID=1562316 RepID=A0A6B7FIB7_EPIEO|nr:maturase [Epirixanthes elongata]QBB73137.1 maturase [Epirixanthes elongata]